MEITATQIVLGGVFLSGVVMLGKWILRLWTIYLMIKEAKRIILAISVVGAGGLFALAPEGSIPKIIGNMFVAAEQADPANPPEESISYQAKPGAAD